MTDQDIADYCERKLQSRPEADYSEIVTEVAAILQLPQLRVHDAWAACSPDSD